MRCMNNIRKKKVCDILDSDHHDLRKALASRFIELDLGEVTSEDYHLLDETIATLKEGTWTSDDFESDYKELKTDIYEALLREEYTDEEGREDYVGASNHIKRGSAVIDFTFDWLRCVLDENLNKPDANIHKN